MAKLLIVGVLVMLFSTGNGKSLINVLDLEKLILELRESRVNTRAERTITEVTRETTFQQYGLQRPAVTVAAFNIQVFGDTKYGKKDVVEIILKILERYDLILIQEIRDTSGDSFLGLVQDLIEKTHHNWDFSISGRLGRTDSKEQYAYLYRSDVMSLEDAFTYDDSGDDRFEREPYCAKFRLFHAAVPEVGFMGIHTKPDHAETEVDALVDVYDSVKHRFGTENIILMGDFNADCSYISKSEWPSVRLRSQPRFQWLIGDGVDTTTKNTHCAYDRIVVAGSELQNSIQKSSVKIFPYNKEYGLTDSLTKQVSDHYPVQLDIVGKISDEVLDNVKVDHSITIHSDVPVNKTQLKTFANSLKVAKFVLEVSKAGRGIRSVVAERLSVTNVPAALQDLQRAFPSLISNVVIATAQSFLETRVLEGPVRVVGFPAYDVNSNAHDVKIVYLGRTLTYDVTISKTV